MGRHPEDSRDIVLLVNRSATRLGVCRAPARTTATAMGRAVLASGALGQHRGLPTTVIVQTTLQDLHEAAGAALTGGGTSMPISDVIRMASSAYPYLAIFDKHSNRPLYLGRTRIANAD